MNICQVLNNAFLDNFTVLKSLDQLTGLATKFLPKRTFYLKF